MVSETRQIDLRAEHVDAVVKNFALQEFKGLSICNIVPTNADKNTYFDETDADLTKTTTTGITKTSLGGTPRGAEFNIVTPSWAKKSEYPSKHTGKAVILWEDTLTDNMPVVARTLLRVTRTVSNSMDKVIVTEIATTTNTTTAVATWDNAVISDRDPIFDILTAKEYFKINNWDIDGTINAFIWLHPTNEKELLRSEEHTSELQSH